MDTHEYPPIERHPVMDAEQFRPYQPTVRVADNNLIDRIRARASAEAERVEALQREVIDLRRRLADAEQAVLAFAIMERRGWSPEKYRNQWRIRLLKNSPADWPYAWSACYDSPMRALLEEDKNADVAGNMIDRLRAAGGSDWDKIDDPEAFLGRKE